MRKIFKFQRYSQPENWITNNTLLFLSLLYQYNQEKFEAALNTILNENILSINVGVQFYQQERKVKSVFDGTIEQKSFKIAIETKIDNDFTVEQLKNHIQGLAGEKCEKKILLMLSKNEISKKLREEVYNYIQTNRFHDVVIASTSYSNIIRIINESINDYEYEFKETISEYLTFCEENNLIDKRNSTMMVLTSGTSLVENLKYDLFYDPAERSNNVPFRFLGLYHDKVVSHVGEVLKTVKCNLVENELELVDGSKNSLTNDEKERIKSIILETKYYNIRKGCKFYVVDKFYPTNFVKRSFSSLRSKRYFFLDDIEQFNECFNSKEVANFLNGKEWE